MPNVSANIDTFLRSADNAAARTNLGVLPLAGGTLTGNLNLNYNILNLGGNSSLTNSQLSIQNDTSGTAIQPNYVLVGQNEYYASLSGSQITIGNSDAGKSAGLELNTSQVPENVAYYTPATGGILITEQSVWPNSYPIGWADTQLRRDSQANTLAIRGDTNAGTVTNRFHIYGFYNNASNYVRASIHCTGTLVSIAAERAGTGAANVDINITPAGTTGRINIMGQTAAAGVIACTHTALIKVNGTQYKVLLSNL